jgi:phage FluMu protein Com
MGKEKTNPRDPNWKHWHVVATETTTTLHVYTWTCPDCKIVNRTKVDQNDDRRRCSFRGVEARCGHCHGTKRRLTDKAGWTFDPSVT